MSNTNTTVMARVESVAIAAIEKFNERAKPNPALAELTSTQPDFVQYMLRSQVMKRILNHSFTQQCKLGEADRTIENATIAAYAEKYFGKNYDTKLVESALELGDAIATRVVSADINRALQGTHKPSFSEAHLKRQAAKNEPNQLGA